MLFSTYTFLVVFLPIVLGMYFLLGRFNWRWSFTWLTFSSLLFYAWWKPDPNHAWNPEFVLLILASCGGNYLCGKAIERSSSKRKKHLLVSTGVAVNIGLLLYYKYLGIFSAWSQAATGWPADIPVLVMPLAVSFFTFLQIAFLVDVYRGDKTGYNFADYVLFVTFFPHLVAGPLVHHRELISQFKPRVTKFSARCFSIGLTVLCIGLFKKVAIADNLAETATPIFQFAYEGSRALTMGEAWVGALAYTFQIYFDFSGYSDMAIGISYLFGLRLPLNFNSPYKAVSIVDFWRRWHMTLSRFLRDYLYIPLGGNRKGPSRRYVNLLTTMLLGGLWHGAGITFVLWGALHGIYLCINHAWMGLRKKLNLRPMPKAIAIAVTFFFVVLAWVPFRAGNYELASLGNAKEAWSVTARFYEAMLIPDGGPLWTPFSDESIMKFKRAIRPVAYALIVAFLLPNTQEFMGRFAAHFREDGQKPFGRRKWWGWRPSPWAAAFAFFLFLIVTLEIDRGGEFIYFQF